MKNKNLWFIGIIIIGVIGLLTYTDFLGSVASGDTVQRTFEKNTYTYNSDFEVTYNPIPSIQWALLETVPSGWSVVDDGAAVTTNGKIRYSGTSAITIKFRTPSSGTSTTFTGQFFTANDPDWSNFQTKTITLCSPSCNWGAVGACETSMSDGCSGTCTRTVNKNTNADTNCNGCVSDSEFPSAVNKWLNQNGITDQEFPSVVNAWLNQVGC